MAQNRKDLVRVMETNCYFRPNGSSDGWPSIVHQKIPTLGASYPETYHISSNYYHPPLHSFLLASLLISVDFKERSVFYNTQSEQTHQK